MYGDRIFDSRGLGRTEAMRGGGSLSRKCDQSAALCSGSFVGVFF